MSLFSSTDLTPSGAQAACATVPAVTTALGKAACRLSQTLPSLESGSCIHYASAAEWSTHDLILHMLRHCGPSRLTAATWSMGEAAMQHLMRALQEGQLVSMRFLVDWRVQVRTPGVAEMLAFNNVQLKVTTCHAKVFTLRNGHYDWSVVGSANFTNNPRIEAGVITDSATAADFHDAWIAAEMANAKPFGCDMRKSRKRDGRA